MNLTNNNLKQLENLPTLFIIIYRFKKRAENKKINDAYYDWIIRKPIWIYEDTQNAQYSIDRLSLQNKDKDYAIVAYSLDLEINRLDNNLDQPVVNGNIIDSYDLVSLVTIPKPPKQRAQRLKAKAKGAGLPASANG